MTSKIPQSAKTCASGLWGLGPDSSQDDGSVHVELVDAAATNGASRARTGDLLHAMQALSQLSYGPTSCLSLASKSKSSAHFTPTTWLLRQGSSAASAARARCVQ